MTEFGKKFYEQSKRVAGEMGKLGRLDDDAAADSTVRRVTLSVVHHPLRGTIVPKGLGDAFGVVYPKADLHIMRLNGGECAYAVSEGIADGALVLGSCETEGLVCQLVHTHKAMVLVDQRDDLANGDVISAADLAGRKVAPPSNLRSFYRRMERVLSRSSAGFEFSQVEDDHGSYDTFLREGGVLFVAPDPELERSYPSTRLLVVDDDELAVEVHLVTRRSNETAGGRMLRDFFARNDLFEDWDR